VAVDAAVDDHHAIVFGFVAAPHVVLANKPSKVFATQVRAAGRSSGCRVRRPS
jgi:hypothetical protein